MLPFIAFSPLPNVSLIFVCLIHVVIGWNPIGLWGASLMRSGVYKLPPNRQGTPLLCTSASPFQRQQQTCLFALPKNHKIVGEDLIRQAAESCGISNVDEALNVDWQSGKIVVTVQSPAYMSSFEEQEALYADEGSEEMETSGEEDLSLDVEEATSDANFANSANSHELDNPLSDGGAELLEDQTEAGEVDESLNSLVDGERNPPQTSVDIHRLSSAISILLGNTTIAEHYEVEVTTPRRKELVLEGPLLQIYKGFEVVCRYINPKTKKESQLTGRLVEQGKKETILRVKGRKKKVPNQDVICITLPEAKYEKGDLYR